tara:strand:+ start:747 stop:1082 length:336 start_codon:yes stop_codon:yes gene_type:complete
MTNKLFKAAMVGALDAMNEHELFELSPDHVIFYIDDWPDAARDASYKLYETWEVVEYHIEKFRQHSDTKVHPRQPSEWKDIVTEVLDALWAIHDDPSEKTKVFLEWIAKQQ